MVNSTVINFGGMIAPYNPDPNDINMDISKSGRGIDAYKNSKVTV